MQTYDYVIVGAGSAGCVLASRLSADPRNTVLLLEAGGADSSFKVGTPGLVGSLWRTQYDWAYFTSPQRGIHDREMHWPRGKVLGGSSSINNMIYMRGHRANYENWLDLGNGGWGYDQVLPYFKRSENNVRGGGPYHGAGGPLEVTEIAANPMSDLLVDGAIDALGIARNDDFNGPEQEGAGRFQVTIRAGKRCSSSVAFLRPVRSRSNLTVETDALVHGVTVENGRAVAVRYRHRGDLREARGSREIVLAAGAIGSPQLLLLSGIGPADEIRALGIRVEADLPGVGKNLQDHLTVPVSVEDKARVTHNIRTFNMLRWLVQHRVSGKGPMASNGAEAGAFVRSSPSAARPDLQFHFVPVASSQINYDKEIVAAEGHGFMMMPTLLYPESRGEIRLASADPAQRPIIDPKYFSEEADLRVLVEGVRLSQRILRSKPLERCRGKALSPLADTEDEETLRAEVRRRCNTLFHPVGTCKMGSDGAAVVDESLRVRGVAGLRVVDASIMPTIVGGNTNAPTIMIGEKGADLILGGSP